MINLGASVVTMDHLNLQHEIEILNEIGGVDYLHIDMMDGHFVPRYGIYPEIVNRISDDFDFNLDVHLMVSDVEFALSQLSDVSNIETVSFHYETNGGRIFKIVDAINKMGAKPILVIDLSTSIQAISELIDSNELSGILFMGIHPGVLKQVHRPENVIRRLKLLKEYCELNEDFIVQIDGGFNFETAKALAETGVNSFVGGTSSIYSGVKANDKKTERIDKIKTNVKTIRDKIG